MPFDTENVVSKQYSAPPTTTDVTFHDAVVKNIQTLNLSDAKPSAPRRSRGRACSVARRTNTSYWRSGEGATQSFSPRRNTRPLLLWGLDAPAAAGSASSSSFMKTLLPSATVCYSLACIAMLLVALLLLVITTAGDLPVAFGGTSAFAGSPSEGPLADRSGSAHHYSRYAEQASSRGHHHNHNHNGNNHEATPQHARSLRQACHEELEERCDGRLKCLFMTNPDDATLTPTCRSWLIARASCVSFVRAGQVCEDGEDARRCLRRIPRAALPGSCRDSDYYRSVRLYGAFEQHRELFMETLSEA